MADGPISIDRLGSLTARQRLALFGVLEEVRQARSWSWRLPVLLHDRCWLRRWPIEPQGGSPVFEISLNQIRNLG